MLESTTRELLLEARDRAAAAGLDATLVLHREKSHLMRIGNNSVSLNTSEALTRLDVRVLVGRREGTHTSLGHVTGAEFVGEAVSIAAQKARVAVPKDYDPILECVEENVDESAQHDPSLTAMDPSVKAGVYAEIIETLGRGYNFSGSWSSGETEIYLVSTASSREACHKGTDQAFTAVLKHPGKKWELQHEQTGWKAGGVTAGATISSFDSLLPVYEGRGGVRNEPGDYTLLLGPSAVAELMLYALWTGASGRLYEEEMGWTTGMKPGDRLFSDKISVVDDPENDLTYRFGFDMAGMRRRSFPVIDRGRLAGLMYDLGTAARYGRAQTGHTLDSTSLSIATGDGPRDPMAAVSGLGRVLVIPALHYMNLPNMSKGIVTGSSRFCATTATDGVVTAPIFSTRLTDSFRNIFANVASISPEAVSVNLSNTYGRRAPVAVSAPSYMVVEKVRMTDCADSF